MKLTKVLILLFCLVVCLENSVIAQVQVKKLYTSYRWYEYDHFGTNPHTVTTLLAKQEDINTLLGMDYDGMGGNPGPIQVNNMNIGVLVALGNTKLSKNTHFIGGISLFKKINTNSGFLDKYYHFPNNPDTLYQFKKLYIPKTIKFIGVQVGLEHSIRISKIVTIPIALIYQPTFTLNHNISQYYYIGYNTTKKGYHITSISATPMKAKKYWQHNIYLSLGPEVFIYKDKLSAKASLDVGIMYAKINQFKKVSESNGFSISLRYKIK